ncbi:MAG: LLM class flavin-dependent oxidoreductase [Candidatus Dormibacteraeota bacterium]|nr:LLM class flavin-dependent oxidoreductase [Candidatus Dormibacteraeota bacterium]
MRRRPFRFGAVDLPGVDWSEQARRLEDLGFDVLLMPDRPQLPSALPALAASAAVTTRLRVGTFVLAGARHVLEVAIRDFRTVYELSGGRFEPGLGAGIEGDAGADRLQRLAELAGATREALPEARILIAASGRRGLKLVATVADTVTISLPPLATEGEVAERIGRLLESAGERADEIELNLNLAAVGDAPNRWLSAMGIEPRDLQAAGSPMALWGSADDMCEQLERRREKLGVSYWSAPAATAGLLAPVIARLGGR